MIVEKEIGIDYGHRVPNHESKCFSPHGHRGRVIAVIEGDLIEEEGDSQQGMDSTVLHKAIDDGNIVYPLTFDYGQRHSVKEIEAARKVCFKLGLNHKVIDMASISPLLQGSSLTSAGILTNLRK